MRNNRISFFCRIYLLVVLLVAVVFSASLYSLLALVMSIAMLLTVRNKLAAQVDLLLALALLFLTPLVAGPAIAYLTGSPRTINSIITVLAVTPAFFLIDAGLKRYAAVTLPQKDGTCRLRLTTTSFMLIAAAFTIAGIALILWDFSLALTAGALSAYFLSVLIPSYLTMRHGPVTLSTVSRRIVASATLTVPLTATGKTNRSYFCFTHSAESWVKVEPSRCTIDQHPTTIRLTLTPPLAGPARAKLMVTLLDMHGLIQSKRTYEPVELHVIPRARYARWLAHKYLEHAASSVPSTTPVPIVKLLKRGIDYSGSRPYQPGDMFKDIDWKHSLKLNRLIIKQYIGTNERAVVVTVNLSVSGAEAADRLAFNFISTLLTLAQESVSTTLAVYNHEKPVLITPALSARDVLKKALALVKDITITEQKERSLQLPRISHLRREMSQLKGAASEPARRLYELLKFEYTAMNKTVEGHPATLALAAAVEHTPPPATLIILSEWNNDGEALLVATDKLAHRDFMMIKVE